MYVYLNRCAHRDNTSYTYTHFLLLFSIPRADSCGQYARGTLRLHVPSSDALSPPAPPAAPRAPVVEVQKIRPKRAQNEAASLLTSNRRREQSAPWRHTCCLLMLLRPFTSSLPLGLRPCFHAGVRRCALTQTRITGARTSRAQVQRICSRSTGEFSTSVHASEKARERARERENARTCASEREGEG